MGATSADSNTITIHTGKTCVYLTRATGAFAEVKLNTGDRGACRSGEDKFKTTGIIVLTVAIQIRFTIVLGVVVLDFALIVLNVYTTKRYVTDIY